MLQSTVELFAKIRPACFGGPQGVMDPYPDLTKMCRLRTLLRTLPLVRQSILIRSHFSAYMKVSSLNQSKKLFCVISSIQLGSNVASNKGDICKRETRLFWRPPGCDGPLPGFDQNVQIFENCQLSVHQFLLDYRELTFM